MKILPDSDSRAGGCVKVAVRAVVTSLILSAGLSEALLHAAQNPSGPGTGGPGVVPTGPVSRLASGKPDLSGVWMPPYVPDMTRNGRGQQGHAEPPFSPTDTPQVRRTLYDQGQRTELPFTPAGQQDWISYDAANGDYTGSCLPFGLTRSVNAPYPFQIFQNDSNIALLFEVNNWFHVVALGVEHPKTIEPTWFGNSVGKWDGDTLIVDTVGFNGYTRLDTVGHPHSAELHVIQTFHRDDIGHLSYTVTIDDPKMYTRPWTNKRTFSLLQGPLIEYSCEENNKSLWEGRIKPWTPPWVKKP
jgi:hypothetical protein